MGVFSTASSVCQETVHLNTIEMRWDSAVFASGFLCLETDVALTRPNAIHRSPFQLRNFYCRSLGDRGDPVIQDPLADNFYFVIFTPDGDWASLSVLNKNFLRRLF